MENREGSSSFDILAVPGPAFNASKEEFAKLKARKQTPLLKRMLEKSKALIKNNTGVESVSKNKDLSI